MHRRERVVPTEVGEHGADRLGEVAVVVLLDQVGDDLGVGLGAEDVALVAQRPAELRVVLDDPVEDDVDRVRVVAVGVRVLLGDAAVRGPAGVGEADRRRGSGDCNGAVPNAVRAQPHGGTEVGEVADRGDSVDLPVREQRDAGRVVPPVLELGKP